MQRDGTRRAGAPDAATVAVANASAATASSTLYAHNEGAEHEASCTREHGHEASTDEHGHVEAGSADEPELPELEAGSAPEQEHEASGTRESSRKHVVQLPEPAASRGPPPPLGELSVPSAQPNDEMSCSWRRDQSGNAQRATAVLLYLNTETFRGEAGERLAETLRLALDARLPILSVHECDEAKGGCTFDRFLAITPDDLVRQRGLYHEIAVPLYTTAYEDQVSAALAAKQLLRLHRLSSAPHAHRPSAVKHMARSLARVMKSRNTDAADAHVSGRRSAPPRRSSCNRRPEYLRASVEEAGIEIA